MLLPWGMRVCSRVLATVVAPLVVSGCPAEAGLDGTDILLPFGDLRGGMVFATRAFVGSAGYDLFYVPVPPVSTVSPQPAFRLTEADGHEWQPSVSPGGNGIAFARHEDGIFFINPNGRVSRISDTGGTSFADSLPAVSHDGKLIAWVREDLDRRVGDSGFVESFIMVANADGSEARALLPKPNIVQDAPRFEPLARSYRLIWSEFDAGSFGASGPGFYGLWLHDPIVNMGSFICQTPGEAVQGVPFRCFGQHTAWPVPTAIVFPQNGLEVYLDGSPADNVQGRIIESLQMQQIGVPVLDPIPGFYRPFPVSASYLGAERMLLDGLVTSVEGDLATLGFFVAAVDGTTVWRLSIQGYGRDFDPENTSGYLFSVATPQLIP